MAIALDDIVALDESGVGEAGAGVTNPLDVGALDVGEPIAGDVTLGDPSDGDAVNDSDLLFAPVIGSGLTSGSGIKVEVVRLDGTPGRGMHGVCTVCVAGLGFTTL